MIWCGFKGLFAPKNDPFNVNDIWQLKDGDFVTVTNRQVDLPSWFELHPFEISDSLIEWMNEKLGSGYEPGEIAEGPHIWRVREGDRLVWVGKSRPDFESTDGILSLFSFAENAAVLGEPFFEGLAYEDLPQFGGFVQADQSQEDGILCQKGWRAALSLGVPRSGSVGEEWTLG